VQDIQKCTLKDLVPLLGEFSDVQEETNTTIVQYENYQVSLVVPLDSSGDIPSPARLETRRRREESILISLRQAPILLLGDDDNDVSLFAGSFLAPHGGSIVLSTTVRRSMHPSPSFCNDGSSRFIRDHEQ
jgi:hypothetical protein